jgi:hypothetical protein
LSLFSEQLMLSYRANADIFDMPCHVGYGGR